MNAKPIEDYGSYLSGMDKSYMDKLFFVDKVEDIDNIFDYGCADGSILNHLHALSPGIAMIGYDINHDMVRLANNKPGVIASTNLEKCIKLINPGRTLINLSSVIHEVYSYSKESETERFWNVVFDTGFRYIAIRDFSLSRSADRLSDINDYIKVLRHGSQVQITDFEDRWGSLQNNRALIHFLMKYRYTGNWDRENNENYFPLTLEKLLSMIPTEKYEIVYFQNYVLPFTLNRVREDFNITIRDNTHVKILLKRK